MLYHIKLYIDIATSMSLALSSCALFILLMQSVNGVQFLIITFISPLFEAAPAPTVFATCIILLTSIYASL